MQIRFAATRPSGSHALVLPVGGSDRSAYRVLGESQAAVEGAARLQRFDGEAGGAAETFIAGEGNGARRLLLVGTGTQGEEAAEKLGGTAVARLITSGETSAVIDLSEAGFSADAAAKVALAAALRSWRYDRYRTKLKDKQKATLTELVIVGAPAEAEARWSARYQAVLDGVSLTRELVTEPANIIYPESFVERCQAAMADTGLEIEVLDRPAMERLGMGALLGVSLGSVREPRLLIMRWNGGGKGAAR
jgi:leucyl aminopeptidase